MQGLWREGNVQGVEAVKSKFHSILGDSGDVFLEGAHGEAAWQKYTADEVGLYRGGGGSYLCGFLTPGAEDSEMTSDRLSGSSA